MSSLPGNCTLFNTPEGALKVFFIYFQEIKKNAFDISHKTILHIGAGDLIGVDAIFLFFGARQVISVDLNAGNYEYPHLSEQLAFYDTLWGLLRDRGLASNGVTWPGIIGFANGRASYNQVRLVRLAPADVQRLPLKDSSVDFAFSNAVLEHVRYPGEAIKEIARVLKPGGHSMHRVDLRDHKNFARPLDFLMPGYPSGGCNLWRAHQFETAFRHHFEIMAFDIFDSRVVNAKEREAFRSPFADLSCKELGKLRFMVYARK